MITAFSVFLISALGMTGSADRLTIGKISRMLPRETCQSLLGDRPGFNTVVRGDVWQVGRLPEQHYVVIVPINARRGDREAMAQALLATVKTCAADAFLVESYLGVYIQAGAFYRRAEAEHLSKVLECQHVDARVVYFP
jgi:hypothetical protein